MAMAQKAWYDKAFISVCGAGGAEVVMQANTTTLSISGGNFDIEGLETFGGKITRIGSKEDIEISFDGIPVSHNNFDWLVAGQTAASAFTTGGASISSSVVTPYRVTLLWTNWTGASVTAATTPITGTSEAYRLAYANAYCVGIERNMDAGDVNKATITFKLAPEDENGVQQWLAQAKDTTSGTLSALNAYTTAVKW
jgi:hypothetical protein